MSKDKLDILKQGFQSECKVINYSMSMRGIEARNNGRLSRNYPKKKYLKGTSLSFRSTYRFLYCHRCMEKCGSSFAEMRTSTI